MFAALGWAAWRWQMWVAILLLSFAGLAALGSIQKMALRRRALREQAELQSKVEDVVMNFRNAQLDTSTVARLEADGLSTRFDKEQVVQKLEEALRAARMGESEQLNQAADVALENADLLPRTAKRLVNSLRVQIYLAQERSLINGELTARTIGKWAALRERWPDLVQMVYRDKALLARLEAGYEEDLASLNPDLASIRGYLCRGDRLGRHVPRLVHLDPEVDCAEPPPPPEKKTDDPHFTPVL
jgi:hypothetical protein